MTRPLLLVLASTVLASAPGCMFWKKDRKPKESSAIASEVEETFRRRWVDQRMEQLQAQGTTPEAARTQAEAEFAERYGFAARPKK